MYLLTFLAFFYLFYFFSATRFVVICFDWDYCVENGFSKFKRRGNRKEKNVGINAWNEVAENLDFIETFFSFCTRLSSIFFRFLLLLRIISIKKVSSNSSSDSIAFFPFSHTHFWCKLILCAKTKPSELKKIQVGTTLFITLV